MNVHVAPQEIPPPPITNWEPVAGENVCSLSQGVPQVTSGKPDFTLQIYVHVHVCDLLFLPLKEWCTTTLNSGALSRSKGEGAFRALSHGYTRWASGHMSVIEINTCNPQYCYMYVRSTSKPPMKLGSYQVYLLLARSDNYCSEIYRL